MITAVALPSILDDLADPSGGSAWIELRKASWIINGYLLVYVLTMPLAGRLTDLWGARRPFLGALAIFTVGLGAGGPLPDDGPADRRPTRPGGRRWRPRPGRHGRGGAPVQRPGAAARARGHRRAHVPRDGRRPVPRRGDPRARSTPRTPSPGPISATPWTDVLRPGLAMDLLHQRPDRDRGTPPRLGRVERLGHAAPAGSHRCRGRGLVRAGPADRPRRADAHRHDRDRRRRRRPRRRDRGPARSPRPCSRSLAVRHGLRRPDPFLDPRLFRHPRVRGRGRRLAAHRVRVRDRDHRRGRLRRPRPLRRARRPAPGPRCPRRPRPRSARSSPGSRSACCRSGLATLVGLALQHRGPHRDGVVVARHRDRGGRRLARGLRVRVRADRDAAIDGRRRGRRATGVRERRRRSSRSRG